MPIHSRLHLLADAQRDHIPQTSPMHSSLAINTDPPAGETVFTLRLVFKLKTKQHIGQSVITICFLVWYSVLHSQEALLCTSIQVGVLNKALQNRPKFTNSTEIITTAVQTDERQDNPRVCS